MVERLIGVGAIPIDEETHEGAALASDEIVLLEFNRNPREMFEALGEALPLRSCREMLSVNGHPWQLVTGAMVFVHPWQYRDVMSALHGRRLKGSSVVVSSSMEHLVAETIADIGRGAWVKQRRLLVRAEKQGEDDSSSEILSPAASDEADHGSQGH